MVVGQVFDVAMVYEDSAIADSVKQDAGHPSITPVRLITEGSVLGIVYWTVAIYRVLVDRRLSDVDMVVRHVALGHNMRGTVP